MEITIKQDITAPTHPRDNIRNIGETEKNFMLWMRSSSINQIAELGLVNAVSLCYCKPNTSAIIANTLKLRNIDFSVYDLDIDRMTIDATTGVSQDPHILFQTTNTTYNKDKYNAGEIKYGLINYNNRFYAEYLLQDKITINSFH